MQTLARIRPQAPTLFLFAQPIGVTLLHGRENTDQARPVAPLRQELLDTIFLAYLLTQKLDLNAFGGRESFGAILDLIGQRRCPLGIVFIRDTARARILFHAPGEANVGERALEHQPVVAGQHAGDDRPGSVPPTTSANASFRRWCGFGTSLRTAAFRLARYAGP
jgi:hypothetical protein